MLIVKRHGILSREHMKKAAIHLLMLLLLPISPPHAGADSVPAFSDQDLERYRTPSDMRRSSGEPDGAPSSFKEKPAAREDHDTLKKFVVPYTAYEGASRRVIIPVRLNNAVTAKMALDTGSPGMIIFDRLAGRLGIFEKDDGKLLTSAAGIGGTTPAIFTIIDTVEVGKAEDRFIPTVVTKSLTNAFEGLIGMDFMANYALKIDTARHVVVFEETPGMANMPGGHDELWWRSNFRNFASTRSAWKQFRESLNKITMENDPKKLEEIKRFADRQYRETDKLFTKLNSYAISHSVPMQWREY